MTTRRFLVYLLLAFLHNSNHQAIAAAAPRGYQADIAQNDGGYPPEYGSAAPTSSDAAPPVSLSPNASSSAQSSSNASSLSSPSSAAGTDQAGCSYWYESMPRNGISAFNGDGSYQVYRSVKDFGAKGALNER
jgi:hypothetical protein